MAIVNEDTKVKLSADGVQDTFSFPFRIYKPEDITVWLVDKATDEVTEQSLGTHYLVVIDLINEGGNVIFDEDHIPEDNYWVFMFSEMEYTQNVVLPTDGAFREEKVSNGLDRIVRLVQQVREKVNRSIKSRIDADTEYTLPVAEGGKFLGWNDAGDELKNRDLPDPSILEKASRAEAEEGTNDAKFTTPSALLNFTFSESFKEMVYLTQNEYDNLTPAEDKLYMIPEE